MATYQAFNGDTTKGITLSPISELMTFFDSFCFETLRSNIFFEFIHKH